MSGDFFGVKHNVHLWEPIDNKFLRACVAEFFAMLLFVVLCCGCAMVTLSYALNPNPFMIAASFGFGILVLAQIFGPLSGGHINCAVSFGLFLAGRTSFIRALCFTFSQMAGSVFGALFLWAIFGKDWPVASFGTNSWDEGVFSGGQVFFAEMLGTALLLFNVLSTIDIPREGGGALGVFPIAMSVMVAHLFLIPIDGCSINPTRSFGPYLVAAWAGITGNYLDQHYMFWFGPLIGGGLAALIYEYGSLKPANFEGGGDMADSLFMALKTPARRVNKFLKLPPTIEDDDNRYPASQQISAVEIDTAISPFAGFEQSVAVSPSEGAFAGFDQRSQMHDEQVSDSGSV